MKFSFFKKIRHLIEGFLFLLVWLSLRYALPGKSASNVSGWLGRTVGPRLYLSNRAQKNITKCFPEKSKAEVDLIIKEMWDNFGRLIAEYTKEKQFLSGTTLKNIEVVGIEHLRQIQNDGKPGIIFTGHIGHWQMISLVAQSIGFDLTQMYRPPNNPWVDKIFYMCQKKMIKNVITKGDKGPRKFISLMKNKEHVLLLVDQKMGEGMSVPFVGRDAMTATGVAKMYLQQNCALLPARTERIKGSKFRVTFYPPIEVKPSGNTEKDIYAILLKINDLISEWIIERPGQWLWLHRRWKDA